MQVYDILYDDLHVPHFYVQCVRHTVHGHTHYLYMFIFSHMADLCILGKAIKHVTVTDLMLYEKNMKMVFYV